MTTISYSDVAKVASQRYRDRLKKSQTKKVDFVKILEELFNEYCEKLQCYDLKAFKSTVSSILHGWKKKKGENTVPLTEQCEELEKIEEKYYAPANEGTGAQFVINQIENMDLNPDSYF